MLLVIYTRKNYELLKTGLNNVLLPILLTVVNNIEQVVEPESSPQSNVTMLNNIVDNIEQCGQHNIVQSCFQQPITTHNFWLSISCLFSKIDNLEEFGSHGSTTLCTNVNRKSLNVHIHREAIL